MPIALTTPLMSNFKRSPIGGATSSSPSIFERSKRVGLAHCRGPVTLGVVKGGIGVAAAIGLGAATGLGAASGLAAIDGHAAAAGERACGKVALRLATALAAAGGHAGACAHEGFPLFIRTTKAKDGSNFRIRFSFILPSPPPPLSTPS